MYCICRLVANLCHGILFWGSPRGTRSRMVCPRLRLPISIVFSALWSVLPCTYLGYLTMTRSSGRRSARRPGLLHGFFERSASPAYIHRAYLGAFVCIFLVLRLFRYN